jgi:hypothetical protein
MGHSLVGTSLLNLYELVSSLKHRYGIILPLAKFLCWPEYYRWDSIGLSMITSMHFQNLRIQPHYWCVFFSKLMSPEFGQLLEQDSLDRGTNIESLNMSK